jgi:hypothetical protein
MDVQQAFVSYLKYVFIYLVCYGSLLVITAPMLNVSRPVVAILAILAAALGGWHGIRATKRGKQ